MWVFTCFSVNAQDVLTTDTVLEKTSDFLDQAKNAVKKYEYIKADLFLDSALARAKKNSSDSLKASLYLEKGNVKKYLNDYGAALDYLINAMRIFEDLGKDKSLVNAFIDIAEFYRRTQDFSNAQLFIEKAKNKYNQVELNDLRLLNKIYHRSAAIHNEYSPDVNNSIQASNKALAIALKIGDSNLMAISYNELGYTYKNLVKIDSAD